MEMETSTKIIWIFSQGRNAIEHWKMCNAWKKQEKRETTEGIKLLNQEIIGTCNRKESYEYLDILEADIIKQKEMMKKIK